MATSPQQLSAKRALIIREHLLSIEELGENLGTNLHVDTPTASAGLSSERAAELLLQHGPNKLSATAQKSELMKFLEQFKNVFMILLLVAALLSIVGFALNTDDTLSLWLGVALIVIVRNFEALPAKFMTDVLCRLY